jgi:hypothetical protein
VSRRRGSLGEWLPVAPCGQLFGTMLRPDALVEGAQPNPFNALRVQGSRYSNAPRICGASLDFKPELQGTVLESVSTVPRTPTAMTAPP